MSEELKKEFYDIFSKQHVDITNPIHVELANTLRLCADWWLAQLEIKLAKQQADFDKTLNSGRKMYELGKKEAQEEFVKRIEDEAVKVCKGDDDCIDTFSEIFADIKSKLNKN